ncbi:PREDICTED: CUB domain-containing protein 1 [Crocodylus porosus]|uniref:CUB domain-containing protein 1 n=1 Tax=Crocodylus porosus TaxID=8502 RepID=UPI00093D679F|nr:PREDICTED: CUB domain-containing protein 1 [Crocodylus porosus]
MAAAVRLAALLLAAAQLLQTAGALEISIPSMDNITITIKPRSSTSQPCRMCISRTSCVTELKIMSGQKNQFHFDCLTPEKYFVMEIQRSIDCITGSCPFGDVHLSPSGLPRLNKTFIWNVKASKKVGLQLKFSTPWLRQIGPTETCPDLVTYNIRNCIDTTTVNIGTFCRNGSVSRVKVQGGVIMSLQIPWNASLTTSGFNIANRSSIKRLCIIESTFKGASSATLMSPNYPLGFPEDELMTWQFVVPSNLRASVFFHNYTLSNCERKEERVEYYLPGSISNPEVFKLSDTQPANIAGDFHLSLQGCDQDAQNPGILRLLFQVIVQHPQNEENVTYFIDLSKERNLTMTILPNLMPSEGHLAFEPVCLICKDPRTCDHNLTLTSGTVHRISFLCNDLERLKITAEKTIACWDIRFCHKKWYTLTVPRSIAQLPVRLDKFVWKLLAPEEINVEIVSPSLKLQQHVSELKCNASYSYGIVSTTQRKELNLGVFCPGGAIEKIQMRDNITITLRTYGKRFPNESVNQDLKMSFVPFIKEECIFTVTPDPKDKVYLQTPNWYDGLPPHVTVSWNITVPRKQAAHLTFSKDRMGIACETGRAYVNIKEQKQRAEEIVRREDEPLPEPLDMYHHFWVNISNCKPVDKKLLSLQFRVTFMQRKTDLVVIITAVVGAGLLIAIGVIICCIRKKKKKNQNPAVGVYNANVGVYNANVGVYNANVNTRMPRKPAFFKKRREDNNSHVYAVIDEAMVYGHLLKESKGSVDPEVDVYRPFDGPIGEVPPTPPPFSFRKEGKVSDAQDLPSLTLTDAEIYTFAHHKPEDSQSNGDTNAKSNGDVSMSLLESKEQEGSME